MDDVKLLAYFLPQFHEIPENNEWWGEGFTEWTNVKRKNKVSKNLLPLNNNYYNLLEKDTVEWQTKLARDYGVYGFVYYHYYFNGKKLLEKPAENLLKWKDIDQKFCFCWANHSWNRSWDGEKTILLEQTYGIETDWAKHFEYLLSFFNDKRYIKVDNKPMFLLTDNFAEKNEMFECFNKWAIEKGFNGIHLVETCIDNKVLNRIKLEKGIAVIREHNYTMTNYLRDNRNKLFFFRVLRRLRQKMGLLPVFNGNPITKSVEKYAKNSLNEYANIYFGLYSQWDNTPRHGKRGYKITKASRKNFLCMLRKIYDLAKTNNREFIFFNAWNEWAEGMILEPDTVNKYHYLECIKEVFGEDECLRV